LASFATHIFSVKSSGTKPAWLVGNNLIRPTIQLSRQTVSSISMESFSNKTDNASIYRVFADQKLSDRSIREVKPYIQEFNTFAKGRWLGRELIEVLSTEFGAHPLDYWKNAIGYGFIRINDKKTYEHYRFQNSDKLGHRAHRYDYLFA
jgi:hypothetical protein